MLLIFVTVIVAPDVYTVSIVAVVVCFCSLFVDSAAFGADVIFKYIHSMMCRYKSDKLLVNGKRILRGFTHRVRVRVLRCKFLIMPERIQTTHCLRRNIIFYPESGVRYSTVLVLFTVPDSTQVLIRLTCYNTFVF